MYGNKLFVCDEQCGIRSYRFQTINKKTMRNTHYLYYIVQWAFNIFERIMAYPCLGPVTNRAFVHLVKYFQLHCLPSAVHARACSSRFWRVASVLASVSHSTYSRCCAALNFLNTPIISMPLYRALLLRLPFMVLFSGFLQTPGRVQFGLTRKDGDIHK